MEHQTRGRWVVCPIDPASQRIILKIVGFLVFLWKRAAQLKKRIHKEFNGGFNENLNVQTSTRYELHNPLNFMHMKCNNCPTKYHSMCIRNKRLWNSLLITIFWRASICLLLSGCGYKIARLLPKNGKALNNTALNRP